MSVIRYAMHSKYLNYGITETTSWFLWYAFHKDNNFIFLLSIQPFRKKDARRLFATIAPSETNELILTAIYERTIITFFLPIMKEVISTEKSLHHTHITNLINKYDIELNVNQIKISFNRVKEEKRTFKNLSKIYHDKMNEIHSLLNQTRHV
ncbi:hypothetical protein V1477_006979 [Vespula maculifrons]|uniref:Uncharacterized protein n=1 Tax=Vespula maculifrons TaxID=7453 RepID=A0ABD2CH94_VESMC